MTLGDYKHIEQMLDSTVAQLELAKQKLQLVMHMITKAEAKEVPLTDEERKLVDFMEAQRGNN